MRGSSSDHDGGGHDGGGRDDDGHDHVDPFAPIEASPRFATPLAWIAMALGVLAAVGGLSPLAGPLGMGVGLVAHVKGSRLGMPSAVVAGVGMIIGMAITLYAR